MSAGALEALADFDRDAALAAGLDPGRVREWGQVANAYFGPTRTPAQQRTAASRAQAFSLDQLVLIERRLQQVPKPDRMRLRLELLATDPRRGYKALSKRAAELVSQPAPPPPRKQVSFTRSRGGRRTMSVTADERDLADLEHHLSRDIDTSKPAAPQMLENFLGLIRGGSTASDAPDAGAAAVPHAAPRPLIVIPLPAWVRIVSGQGDDTLLGLSDGTTITGADYLRDHHAKDLDVALFHPVEGPVNLYRTQRFASSKQRDLLRATSPVCPVPGCRHGADACEIHHITAWKHGGETNLANLAPLCRYHNRVNDDDPGTTRRGRIENVGGVPVWHSPSGRPVRNPYHPFGAMDTLFA